MLIKSNLNEEFSKRTLNFHTKSKWPGLNYFQSKFTWYFKTRSKRNKFPESEFVCSSKTTDMYSTKIVPGVQNNDNRLLIIILDNLHSFIYVAAFRKVVLKEPETEYNEIFVHSHLFAVLSEWRPEVTWHGISLQVKSYTQQ